MTTLVWILLSAAVISVTVGYAQRDQHAKARDRAWWASVQADRAAVIVGLFFGASGVVSAVVDDNYFGIASVVLFAVIVAAVIARTRLYLATRRRGPAQGHG